MPPYDAITFDTQTIKTNSFDFKNGWLPKLARFKDTETNLIVSEVVFNEVMKHLIKEINDAKSRFRTATKDALYYGVINADPSPSLREEDAKVIAREQFAGFLKEIGCGLVRADDVSVREVLSAYFGARAPFSDSGKKKNEFPDAIALISLEKWAKKHGKKILAISGDGDWERHAAKSESIDHVKDIEQALKLFSEAETALLALAMSWTSEIAQPGSKIALSVEKHLETQVENMDIAVEADSAYRYENDMPFITLKHFSIIDEDGRYDIDILEDKDGIVVVRIPVEITAEVESSFTFYVHDSIDSDDIPMGASSVSRDEVFEANILVTFYRDGDNVDIRKCELVDYPSIVEFGTVNPDFEDKYEQWFEEPEDEGAPEDYKKLYDTELLF